jgi:putative ABC transport system permease protein
VLGLEGRLAHRQIRRWPVRTALTAGVLYIAVTMGIGQGTVIINCIDDVRIWERRTNVADFFLRADFADTTTGQAIELPAQLANEIRNIPDVTNMDTISVFDVSIAGQRAFAVAGDFTGADLPIDLYRGDPSLVRQRLLAGEVVLGTVLAQQTGVQPGDEITLDTRQGARPFRVAALTIDYMVGGHIIYMHRALAQRLFGVEGASMFLIRALPDARPAVQSSLEALAKRHGLMLHSAADLSRMVESIAAGVVSGVWGIRVLGFVVAALGIANTLTMNVLDQTRELAVLRVVGMTRRQVHKTVLSQAVLIGLIGLLLGLFVGIFAAYVINLVMLLVLGFPVPLVFDPDLLLGCSLAVIGLVLAAALLPARRAARLDLLTALQYE